MIGDVNLFLKGSSSVPADGGDGGEVDIDDDDAEAEVEIMIAGECQSHSLLLFSFLLVLFYL